MPAFETPERREAREAKEAFEAGKINVIDYIRAQPAGTKIKHGGQQYLSTIDGPQMLNRVPISTLGGRNLQTYRNPGKITHYREIIRQAQAEGRDPVEAVEPITAEDPKVGGYTPQNKSESLYLADGHHRVDAAEAEGLTHVNAWMPAVKGEGTPMGKIARLRRLGQVLRLAKRAKTLRILKERYRKGDAAEPTKVKPGVTEFNYGANVQPSITPSTPIPSSLPPTQPNTSRVPVGLRSEDWEQWHPSLLMEHEKAPIRRAKTLKREVGKLEKMETLLQSTISGRHGRHWYDENHDITHAMNAHSSDPMDVFRDFGMEAGYSPNNGIVNNHKASLAMKRLYQMGTTVGGKDIEPRTQDPEKIKTLLNAYAKGDAIFYPKDYVDPSLRGQLVVKRDVDPKSGEVKKMIHTDEGWNAIPLVYPVHNQLVGPVLANPERFTNPHGHGSLTRKPMKADSFLRNKLGNHEPVTIDRHEARGWGVDTANLSEGVYHLLAAGGRHLTNLLQRPEFNPHHEHPIYGRGWTPARGQAARWMTMRGLAERIQKGETPEQAALGLKARDIYEASSFVRMYEHPELRGLLRTMIREGHVSPTFFRDLKTIESRYKPTEDELNQVVGHEDLIPLAKKVHAAVSAAAKAEKRRLAIAKKAPAKITKSRLKDLFKKARTVAFSSPNVEQLDFGQALNRLSSDNHKQFRDAAAQLLSRLKVKGKVEDAIGDWEDGAENSLVHDINVPGHDLSRYIAAWLGRIGKQKAILHFVPDKAGKDVLHETTVPNTDLAHLRGQLSDLGINFRTLVPQQQGTKVILFDEGGQLSDRFSQFARNNRGQVQQLAGTGEFIGGPDRAAASEKYRQIIGDYESAHGQSAGGAAGNNPAGPSQAPEGGAVSRGIYYRGGAQMPGGGV